MGEGSCGRASSAHGRCDLTDMLMSLPVAHSSVLSVEARRHPHSRPVDALPAGRQDQPVSNASRAHRTGRAASPVRLRTDSGALFPGALPSTGT